MKIAIASDHGAYELKQKVVKFLNSKKNIEIVDVGTYDETISVDYPDYANKAVDAINSKKAEYAIIMCGTGIGISIAANKHKGIRAALCHDAYGAEMAKMHNNANILAFGGRTTGIEIAKQMIDIWINTKFEGGRHQNRLDKITEIENL